MKKILSVIFLVLCCFSVFAFGTEEVMLDPESPLYLQDIPFYEVSAKDGININGMFTNLAKYLLDHNSMGIDDWMTL